VLIGRVVDFIDVVFVASLANVSAPLSHRGASGTPLRTSEIRVISWIPASPVPVHGESPAGVLKVLLLDWRERVEPQLQVIHNITERNDGCRQVLEILIICFAFRGFVRLRSNLGYLFVHCDSPISLG